MSAELGARRKGSSSEARAGMKGTGAYSLRKHSGPSLALCERAALLEHISSKAAETFINVLPAKASTVGVWL